MICDDDEWLRVADAFQAAAIDGEWISALERLASATGSEHGQLVCMGEDATTPLNLLTNVHPELPAAFVAAGGSDPSVNPRRRAGLARPPLTVIAEADFITPDAYKRDIHYQEFALPWNVPYICLTTLERRAGLLVGLSVVRTERQGHIDAEGRRVFASIAPQVRAAVRTSLALGDASDALLSDAFETLSIPAFICDQAGLVRRLTPAAERLVASARGLQLKAGRLATASPNEAVALANAIAAAAGERKAGEISSRTVIVRASEDDAAPLVIDIAPLSSRPSPFTFDARVLLLVRGMGDAGDKRRRVLLQTVYGMTSAETDIALQIFGGKTPEEIAATRGVSVGTVRAQIKTLLAKAGVSRQVELVARLGRL